MQSQHPTAGLSHLKIELASRDDKAGIAAAIAIGDKARKTLGLLPAFAYYGFAEKKNLLLAKLKDQVVGYALFSPATSKNRIRLAHLCVHPNFRNNGIARSLVNWISSNYPNFNGIRARCRHDYGYDDMWIRLGFTPCSASPGRSKLGHELINWWRDHGHPTLFSNNQEERGLRAAVDMEVVVDIANLERSSSALIGEEFSDQIELVKTAALDNQMAECSNIELRRKCLAVASNWERATGSHRQQLDTAAQLEALIDQQQLGHDVRSLIESIAAGIAVYIVKDGCPLLTLSSEIESTFGSRILTPAEVMVEFEDLSDRQSYRPLAIHGTSFTSQRVAINSMPQVGSLRNTNSESMGDFHRLINDVASQSEAVHTAIYDSEDKIVAAYVTVIRPGMLDVPFIRFSDHPVAETIAYEQLLTIRKLARDSATPIVRLSDPNLSPSVVKAAIRDGGFWEDDASQWAYVINVCGSSDEVTRALHDASTSLNIHPPSELTQGLLPITAAEIERQAWPAKVLDSQICSYIVPIRQDWSSNLLGVPAALFERSTSLGLSREHVYYKSPMGIVPRAPGRLLWYMSEGGKHNQETAAVVGCSQLTEVIKGTPVSLHKLFRNLGTWSLEQLESVARGGTVQALRFSNTEIFPNPVRRKKVQEIAKKHSKHGVPYSLREIGVGVYADIYREGYRA